MKTNLLKPIVLTAVLAGVLFAEEAPYLAPAASPSEGEVSENSVATSYERVSLSAAYEMALNNDENVKSVMYEAEAAKERRKQATAALLPSIDAQVVYNGEKYDKKYATGKPQKMDETFTRYGVTLNQQVFRPELWIARSQESLREDAYAINYDISKQELAKKVSEAYFNLAYANANLDLAKSYELATKARYDQLDRSLQMGIANKMDALEAKVRHDEAILGVNKALRQIEISRLALAKYVGHEVEVDNNTLSLATEYFENLDLSIYDNYLANLEYKQSELSSQIAQKEKTKRAWAFGPSVDFSVSLSNYDYKDDVRFGDEDNKVETMVRFTLPLWRSGANYERLQEGELLKMASLSRQLDTQRKVSIDQKNGVASFNNFLQEAKIMRDSLEHAQIYQHATERGYEEGLRSLIELLDAKARVFRTQIDALKASYQLVLSYLELEFLIGNISSDTIKTLEGSFFNR